MPPGPLSRTLGVPDLDEEARQRALAERGPSWKEWFYFEFLKVWIVLGLLIVDSWIIAIWLDPINVLAIVGSVAVVLYAEFLLYRCLWYRPDPDHEPREFHRTYLRPVRFGRWTPEAWRVRAGLDPMPGSTGGPDPREFL